MPEIIEIYSDIICPWCYLGKRNLDAALRDFSESSMPEIRFLPFELNPGTPLEGVNRREYLEAKYGSSIAAAEKRLVTMGKDADIEFNFDAAEKIPNTFKAHRLLWMSHEFEKQKALSEALFEAYFTKGRDMNHDASLLEIAVSAGLEAAAVQALLGSDRGDDEVRELERRASELGITGVPFFIIDGKYGVSGAQPVDVFREILAKAA